MAGLWMKDPDLKGGKFLVLRRDGTQPEWPYFVLGARDPAAARALMAYSKEARRQGMDETYCDDIRELAAVFIAYRKKHGPGDPDAPPHRKDDEAVVEKMTEGHSS